MFSGIPQKLPFGLLGDEAKLAFRSRPEGISKLVSTRNISERSAYWDQYFTLFDSASDVFSLVLPHDIRRGLNDAPENIATLLRILITRLENLISDHTFPSSIPASVTSFASTFVKSGLTERNTTKEALNAIRVLQRILPVVFEVELGANKFEADVLWTRECIDDHVQSDPRSPSPQFVIDDEEEEEDGGSESRAQSRTGSRKHKYRPARAERLLNAIVGLLFCRGFTLPSQLQVDRHKINYAIWEKGVGSTLELASNPTLDSHKVEILRLLLILMSRQIYMPPNLLLTNPSPYSIYLVQQIPRRHVLVILCSLINTALKPRSGSANIIAGMRLPYDHLVFKGEDPRTTLIATSFQVLCALLDFQSGSARDLAGSGTEKQCSCPTSRTNGFRYFLAKLHRIQDFAFLMDGIMDVLETHIASVDGLLPGSRKPLPYTIECVLMTWKLLEINQKFRLHTLNSAKATDFVSCLLVLCLELKEKSRDHGMCRAISHILQMLSTEASFGQVVGSTASTKIPARWSSSGTTSDFLVNSVYSLITTTSGSLSASYPALVITLSNSAPYFKHLSVTASTRLVQLYASFAKPSFLLSDEGHPRLLFFILEVFNGVISHHLADNPHLVYAILSSHQSFEAMSTFTLHKGLQDIANARRPADEQPASRSTGKNEVGQRSLVDANSQKGKPSVDSTEDIEACLRSASSRHDTAHLASTERTASRSNSTCGDAPLSRPSDKAQGKMKARRISSSDTAIMEALASVSGRTGFVPTHEWVTSWQQGLPLDPILVMTSELLPKINDIQALRSKAKSTSAVVDYLTSVSLDSVIPRPQFSLRQFVWTDAAIIWLTSLVWGEIYVHNVTPLGLWALTNVRLFQVKQNQQRPLVGTVSDVVGGLLGRAASDSGLNS